MGAMPSAFIFQENMDNLMRGLDHVLTYLDDILCVTKGDYTNHINKLGEVLKRLQDAGLKVNLPKCAFAKQEFEYLGYNTTKQGIKPLTSKVEAIRRIKRPKTLRQLRSFIGMINYYRDMWNRRSHMLSPVTDLIKSSVKGKPLKWTDTKEKAFENIKTAISKQTVLAFPDFSKPFQIHVDASEYQLGGVVSQEGKPIAFYSRKLSQTQQKYTTGEREMLSIVETLKEYRNILLGHCIQVYTDHKNHTNPRTLTASARVHRWRWVFEEFGPEIKYIPGHKNTVADCLSRLERDNTEVEEAELNSLLDEEEKEIIFPLDTGTISKHQRDDETLMKCLNNHPDYFRKTVHGQELIMFKNKVYIPATLRNNVIEWYHEMLQHPGANRTEKTIRQHMIWPNLSKEVTQYVKHCKTCQIYKNTNKKHGKMPTKEFHYEPWDTICVDLIGPYTVKTHDNKTLTLQAMTICNPATGWFEIKEIKNKKAATAAAVLNQTWFARYPRPKNCIFDNGLEFLGFEFQQLLNSYGVKPTPTTIKIHKQTT